MKLVTPLVILAASTSSAAFAQNGSGLTLGGQVGAYFLSDSAMRSVFGDSIFSVGLSPVNFGLQRSNTFSPSFNALSANRNGSKFFLAPIMYGYEIHLSESNRNFLPYVRFDAGVAYADYSITDANGRHAAKRFLPTGAVEVGTIINNSIRLSARYHVFSKVDGISFNGIQLQLTFALFKVKV